MKFGPELLSDYDYELPAELVPSEPREPRDSARLFVFDSKTGKISFDVFSNLTNYLPEGSVLALNDTKVVPARITVRKPSGGKAELLLLVNEFRQGDGSIKALSDRRLELGSKLWIDSQNFFLVVGQREKIFELEPNFSSKKLDELLQSHGRTPVPKYLGLSRLAEPELRTRYQTVFAQKPASVAAPTASLHFTADLMAKFTNRGIRQAFVSLHVGLGTFSPIGKENFETNRLHAERYEIKTEAAKTIVDAKAAGWPVVAVGTTVVRALESAAAEILAGRPAAGETEIFIRPPFEFKIADMLVTNFHLPKSSLMCLVDAFLQFKQADRRLKDLYELAKAEKFRFYSFGDAMLIL